VKLSARCRLGPRLGLAVVALAVPSSAIAALPTVTVGVVTSPPLTNPAHTGVTLTAGCATGRLVSGGSFLRLVDPVNGGNAPGPGLPKVPSNGLVLGGSVPSTGATPVDVQVGDGAVDPSRWMTISNFTGQAEQGDQASTFAMCAATNPAHTVVKAASTTGANAPQATTAATDTNLMGAMPPIVTTATCPAGSTLAGGGALTSTPDTVNDGATAGNNSNLKPVASYPSDASGGMLPDGSTGAVAWSAYGSSGANVGSPTDKVVAIAVCSTDAATPPVAVARQDTVGPLAQIGTTVINSPVSCPAGTRLLSGGYRLDETVGQIAGLQPQQGYHMRGTYPAAQSGSTYLDGSNVEAADATTNPTTWTSVGQLGGQSLGATQRMVQHGFALCALAVAPPTVTTGAPSTVGDTSAGLTGSVDPHGLPTTFVFEFGPSLSFGSIAGPASAGQGQGPVALTASLAGLSSATTYYYRVVASNSQGTTFGSVASFTTTGPATGPDAVTLGASSVANTTAVVSGQVNPRRQSTTYTFEYGPSTSFGTVTPPVALDSANVPEAVSNQLSGLSPNTTYYYRLVASNATATTLGAVQRFTTGPTGPPAVITGAAGGISSSAATLAGSVDGHGEPTSFTFEYGTSTSFGSISAIDNASPVAGVQPVSLPISGLTPATTYLYRLVASDADGTTAGPTATFKTGT
jgi:hypothetical protein